MSAVAVEKAGAAGYVEATTATAILGWAWSPGVAAPLKVELRLGGETLSEAVADELRDDLARGGIGEGRHAFTLPVPEQARTRLAELRVFARTADGAATPLGSPPPEDGLADTLNQLKRGIEMLVGSQRVMHRNLQAALLARAEQGPPAGASPIATGAPAADTAADIAALEVFVTRLERSLAAQPVPAQPAAPRRGLGAIAAVAVLVLIFSVCAMLRVMPA